MDIGLYIQQNFLPILFESSYRVKMNKAMQYPAKKENLESFLALHSVSLDDTWIRSYNCLKENHTFQQNNLDTLVILSTPRPCRVLSSKSRQMHP